VKVAPSLARCARWQARESRGAQGRRGVRRGEEWRSRRPWRAAPGDGREKVEGLKAAAECGEERSEGRAVPGALRPV